MALEIYVYDLPLLTPLRLQGRLVRRRQGVLLRQGDCWSEAAPLLGFSQESLDEIVEEARSGPPFQSPSLQFAWSCLDDPVAPQAGLSVPINGLLNAQTSDTPQQILDRIPEVADYEVLKLKVGGTDNASISATAELVQQIQRRLQPHQRLRLDANRCWNWDQALSFARQIQGISLEYIEEPFADPARFEAWLDVTGIPYALDETLYRDTPTHPASPLLHRLRNWPRAAAFVCKPTLLGGAEVLAQLADLGPSLVLSGCFESGVGIAHLIRWATRWSPGIPVGLDTYRWLADDVLSVRHFQQGCMLHSAPLHLKKGVRYLTGLCIGGPNKMGRAPRADEANGIYHMLNRGNRREPVFHKTEDFEAFEQLMDEALDRSQLKLFAYCLLPNHWHMVVSPEVDGAMGRFGQWLGLTHTQRHHAHYQTAWEGHLYQGRFKSFPVQNDDHFLAVCRYVERNAFTAGLCAAPDQWRFGSLWRWAHGAKAEKDLLAAWPIPRRPNWIDFVAAPLTEKEQNAMQRSISRGVPLGDECWVKETVQRLGLESTVRARGRPKKLPKSP